MCQNDGMLLSHNHIPIFLVYILMHLDSCKHKDIWYTHTKVGNAISFLHKNVISGGLTYEIPAECEK